MLSANELIAHIEGCVQNRRESQKAIYSSFYGYAMAICDRYVSSQDDALEIMNDGFLKVFLEIGRFKPAFEDVNSSFKGWLRKIMVYTAIDHFRRNKKHRIMSEIEPIVYQLPAWTESALDHLSYEEIIRSIQYLSPAYRTVLNLFIIEGFSHDEISKELGISIGTSKSNLAKARKQLQKILFNENKIEENKNAV